MKNRRVNPGVVWKQLEDWLAPRLRMSPIDRAAYSHLFRHSHLKGKRRVRFSIKWLALGIRVSESPTRQAVRRLMEHGALRLVERTKLGHVVEVRLPEEIGARRPAAMVGGDARAGKRAGAGHGNNLEEVDFLRSNPLRQAIHCAGARALLLLSAPNHRADAVPRPCRAASSTGTQFLPQSRLLLRGMQFAERRDERQGLSPLALPREPLEQRRIHEGGARA